MSEPCDFCGGPVNPFDESTYKQVTGWVHGKKRDSMTLRADTGKYAHTACVLKAKGGNAPDQPDLFGEPAPRMLGIPDDRLDEILEFFETPGDVTYPEPREVKNDSLGDRDEEAL